MLYTLTFWPPMSRKPTFQLACDGLLVINRLSNNHPIDLTEPHADLLMAACNLINTSTYMIQLVFVWGHQDNGIPTILTRDAWLNIKANQLAKQKLTSPHTGPSFITFQGTCGVASWGRYKWLNNSTNHCGSSSMDKTCASTGNSKKDAHKTLSKRLIGNHSEGLCVRSPSQNDSGCPNRPQTTLPMERIWYNGISAPQQGAPDAE